MKKKINNKGFTLIELLAIIAITAIVLGIGTYGIVDLVTKSKEKGSLISETSIKESASLYADEAGDSLWIDPGSGNYKYYCITIEELINKGIIKKNAKLPKGIDKYNYVSIKKNKVTFVNGESLIIKDALDGSADASVCVGNIIKEKIEIAPKEKNVTSYTDEIDSVFDDLVGESKIIDKTCYFNKDSSSIVRDDGHKGDFDKSSNTCLIKGLDDETIYYYKTCMTTEKGSIICSNSYSTSTASFVSPEFSTKDDTITIKYKDDNVKEPYHYFKSNVNGNSDKNVSECVLGSDNKFTCSGSTSNITKDKWYKVNENGVKITYKDNEIKNGDITARIMDGTGNYKDSDKKFNLYRTVFKKGNADKINNSTNDITNICLNDIDKKCNIKSPSISKDGYTIVGWNTDSSASSSIWKANTSKDIDGSNTYYPIIKSRVNIKLNVNGGRVTEKTSKGGTYTTDSSGIISRNGKNIFHTINYGEKMNSSGLANYNNKDYLYITKNGSIVTKNKEWICLSGCTTSGKVYSQYEAYSSDDFCDAKEKSCTVVLGVNWKNENYTLTYDNNGGSGCTSKSMNYGDEYGTLCTPSKRGYAFVGWFDNNYKNSPLNYYADTYSDLKNAFGYDANRLYKHYFEYGLKEGRRISQYISSDIYNTEGNKTIYAGWKGVVYRINYNANGGTGTMESNNAEFGTNVTIKNNGFTRDGYTFAGWTTKSNGTDDGYGWTGWSGTWNYADGQYGIAENKLVLYARWKKNKVYIKLDANGGSVRGSTTYGSCRTNNNLIGCSWNSPKELFHTIDYGDSLDSAGLANYNNPDYLYITKDGYFAYASEAWICDSSSGCSTVGKTFDQDKAYKASEFCDASGGDCTVTLKVNWKKIDTTINDWRCHDKYSYFITYCDSDDMCEYTARAYKENGASYSERVYGKINRNNLNLSSCFVDNIDDYRCNSNGKYKITTCSVTTCIYTELNGNTMNPNNLYIVDRDTLKECVPDTKTMYVTSSNGVNCRYGAGTSYGIAVAYSCGAALTVNVNATNGWYYVTNDGCYSVGSALSSSKPSSCVGSSGGGTSGGCKKIVKCITSAGSDAQCRSKISSLGGSYAGYNGKGDCIGNFCRSSCPSGSVETGGFY
ncbi:MAG: InlB B-repeat-containing protein [Bacilli bacterium]|nr:InlB B-repeat-containing protein [Bacilli bacterium]